MTLRSWVVVGPVGGRPARNVWYSPHYAHVRGVTGADQPQHRSSASPRYLDRVPIRSGTGHWPRYGLLALLFDMIRGVLPPRYQDTR